MTLPALAAYSGPASPKMLLIGEAWGEGEEINRRPFCRESGKELWRMLGEAIPEARDLHSRISALHIYGDAWIKDRDSWLSEVGVGFTNLINLRPAGNKFDLLCASQKEVKDALPEYDLPAIDHGKYLRPEYLPELVRLHEEIERLRPNLIVCLGNKATWGILRSINIGSIRGAITEGYVGGEQQPFKVLPTYHPAGVLRNWSWRPIVIADLMKAWRECQFPEIRRPRRRILINPTLAEVEGWITETLYLRPPYLSIDCETSGGMIDTIGFARARDNALVIPFRPHRQKIGQNFEYIWPIRDGRRTANYWTHNEEIHVWNLVERLLDSDIPKVFQNGLYDLQYILPMNIRPRNVLHDTMLRHHAKFPEMQKGLGFLGSIYTNEPAWKLMRRKRPDTEKRDE